MIANVKEIDNNNNNNNNNNKITLPYVKRVRIRSYPGSHFPAFGLNMDQNTSEYGHFSSSVSVRII